MNGYSAKTERRMVAFFETLSEKDRRRYAAVEADKLGHGGMRYIAELLGIDPKTIRQGRVDLDLPTDAADGRVRKKPLQQNLWSSFGSGSFASAWYRATCAASSCLKP